MDIVDWVALELERVVPRRLVREPCEAWAAVEKGARAQGAGVRLEPTAPSTAPAEPHDDVDDDVDDALDASFPASDPPPWTLGVVH